MGVVTEAKEGRQLAAAAKVNMISSINESRLKMCFASCKPSV